MRGVLAEGDDVKPRPELPGDMERAHRKWKRAQARKRASEAAAKKKDQPPADNASIIGGFSDEDHWPSGW